MAANPMQKKVRNSFLLGMTITLVICLLVVAIVYFLFFANKKTERGQEVNAYVLTQNVKSGQVITANMLKKITVYSNMIPANYVDDQTVKIMQLQDEKGNVLNTNSDGVMYIQIKDGNKTYKTIKDDQVIVDQDANGYYKTLKTGTEKEYIKFENVPVVAKVNMYANTVLTTTTLSKSDQIVTNDVRTVEYNMLTLPINLNVGDYADIRLTFPNGQDFIVIAKKQVQSIQGSTITFNMAEEEILLMSNAIVEYYLMTASNIYVVKYIEPGNQTKATYTYVPTAEVVALIDKNPNIVETAKAKLAERINETAELRSNYMNSAINSNYPDGLENIEAGVQKQIQDAKKAREDYLKEVEATTVNNSNKTTKK